MVAGQGLGADGKGQRITTIKDMETAAKQLYELGPAYVLLKGGHLGLHHESPTATVNSTTAAELVDVLYDGDSFEYIRGPHIGERPTAPPPWYCLLPIYTLYLKEIRLSNRSDTIAPCILTITATFCATDTRNVHGTGCTLASAIACELARGATVLHAVLSARRYLTRSVRVWLVHGQAIAYSDNQTHPLPQM